MMKATIQENHYDRVEYNELKQTKKKSDEIN